MLLELITGIIAPAAVEVGKQWATTKLGGVKATTVEEQIKLDQNHVETLKAVAQLDNPVGTPSQWVVNLRASARYILAGVVIFGGILAQFTPNIPGDIKILSLEASNIVFGFLFGSRITTGFMKK